MSDSAPLRIQARRCQAQATFVHEPAAALSLRLAAECWDLLAQIEDEDARHWSSARIAGWRQPRPHPKAA